MTPPALALRDATAEDVSLLLRFVRALAAYEGLEQEAVATEDDLRRHLFTGPRRAEALIATWDGTPVGMALWFYSFSSFLGRPSLYLEDIFVQPAHRNRGIGRAIFRDLARRALEAGCGRMEWAVLDWNAPSIAFYRSLGALPRSGWTAQRLTGDALQALATQEG